VFRRNKLAAQVTLVKTPKAKDSTPGEDKILHPETAKLITERSKEVVKYVALTVVGVYIAIKAADTLSQIAVKKTKSADNDK
jgi:hypothetical protein